MNEFSINNIYMYEWAVWDERMASATQAFGEIWHKKQEYRTNPFSSY